MLLERSKYAYNNKDAVFYGNHKKAPVWIAVLGATQEQKVHMASELSQIDGVRQLPWPSYFYPEAITYISENAYPDLFKKEKPIEVREQVLIEMTDYIMRHFNNIVGPDPDYGFYLDSQLYLNEDKELIQVFDTILAKQEDLTLSTMYDTLRSTDGVWVTFLDHMNKDVEHIFNTCAIQTVLLTVKDEAFSFNEIVNFKGVSNEQLIDVFENVAKRNIKKAQEILNQQKRG